MSIKFYFSSLLTTNTHAPGTTGCTPPVALSSTAVLPPSPLIFSSCDAMQSINQRLIDVLHIHCTRQGCSSVHCSGPDYEFSLTLHCSEPLGFEIQLANGTDTQSHLFTESGTWNGYNVTVLNMMNKTLGLAVVYETPFIQVTLIKYTEIPADSSACPGNYINSNISKYVNIPVID